ncbi:MAG: hypothetical protein SWZ49_07460 [Cyanobacteriota bacterium]|nr:hypothetical protein [Cyanobacteriota bacterium]
MSKWEYALGINFLGLDNEREREGEEGEEGGDGGEGEEGGDGENK